MPDNHDHRTGNQFAAKPPDQRVTGKGRLNVDLGHDLKARLNNCAGRRPTKALLIEILEEGLTKRGFPPIKAPPE